MPWRQCLCGDSFGGLGSDSLSATIMLLFIPLGCQRTCCGSLAVVIVTIIHDQNYCSMLLVINSLERQQGTNMGRKIQRQWRLTLDWLSNVCLIVQTTLRLYQTLLAHVQEGDFSIRSSQADKPALRYTSGQGFYYSIITLTEPASGWDTFLPSEMMDDEPVSSLTLWLLILIFSFQLS